MITKEEVRDEILSRDSDNKIKSKHFSIRDGRLRNIVHELRMEGHHIASDRDGYWHAQTEEDKTTTLRFLYPKFQKVIDIYRKIQNWKFKPFLIEE